MPLARTASSTSGVMLRNSMRSRIVSVFFEAALGPVRDRRVAIMVITVTTEIESELTPGDDLIEKGRTLRVRPEFFLQMIDN